MWKNNNIVNHYHILKVQDVVMFNKIIAGKVFALILCQLVMMIMLRDCIANQL